MTAENALEPPTLEEDFDNLPEGDGVLTLSSRGRILSSNLQVERIFRLKFESGRSLPLDFVFNSNYLSQVQLAIREAIQGGHSRSNVRAEIKTGQGAISPVFYSVFPISDENGDIMGVTLSFREIAQSSSRSLATRSSTDIDYDALVENLSEGVFTINTRWLITSFNQRAQEITGFRKEEVLGRYCWDIFQSDLCRSGCPLKATLETGVTRVDQDVRIVGKLGRRLTILVNTSVLKDRNQEVIGAIEVFRPLTPPKESPKLSPTGNHPIEIIGQNLRLKRLLDMLPDVAQSDTSVVIEGESGTGKELIARSIHAQSPRADGPFVAVNTSALAETLLESELFGHEKAAFTGAVNSKVGRFEMARGGTLFLDEITEIKPEIQVKLLRVLEEHVFERVGGTRSIAMDARIISATNRSLTEEVHKGRFREDLFYRLRTVPLYMPPLRDRSDDIPLLVDHFVHQLNQKYRKAVRSVDPKVLSLFQRYQWPGNIRELQRILEYAFVFVKGPIISLNHLPELDQSPPEEPRTKAISAPVWEDEKTTIRNALEKAGGSRQDAARVLGISRSSLWRKMKAYGLLDK